nr:13646_t:CDS:2 [Entrophospora candida]
MDCLPISGFVKACYSGSRYSGNHVVLWQSFTLMVTFRLPKQDKLIVTYNLMKSQAGNIIKEKDKWTSINTSNVKFSNLKRERGARFPEVEAALYLWMSQALALNLAINGDILKSKATHFAERLQVTSFAGEANSAPLETLNDERAILQEVIGEYDLCDVYNIDEPELTDEEIIRAVEPNPEVDDSDKEEEVETMVISDKEALNNLEK